MNPEKSVAPITKPQTEDKMRLFSSASLATLGEEDAAAADGVSRCESENSDGVEGKKEVPRRCQSPDESNQNKSVATSSDLPSEGSHPGVAAGAVPRSDSIPIPPPLANNSAASARSTLVDLDSLSLSDGSLSSFSSRRSSLSNTFGSFSHGNNAIHSSRRNTLPSLSLSLQLPSTVQSHTSPSSASAGGPTPTLLSSSTPTAELSFRRFSLPVAPDPSTSPASAVSVYSSLNNNSSNGIPTPRPFSQSFSLPSTNAHFAQKYGTYVPLSSFKTSARKNSIGGHFADAAAAGSSMPGSQMADGHFPQAPVPVTAPVMVSAPKKYPVDFVAWASMD